MRGWIPLLACTPSGRGEIFTFFSPCAYLWETYFIIDKSGWLITVKLCPKFSLCEVYLVYRVILYFWTLLQEMIIYVVMIKNVNINMGHILNGYGCFLIVVNALLWTARRKADNATLKRLEQEPSAVTATRNSQVALFTAERLREVRSVMAFSKTCLKHRFV